MSYILTFSLQLTVVGIRGWNGVPATYRVAEVQCGGHVHVLVRFTAVRNVQDRICHLPIATRMSVQVGVILFHVHVFVTILNRRIELKSRVVIKLLLDV